MTRHTKALTLLILVALLALPSLGAAVGEKDLRITLNNTSWQFSDKPYTWTLSFVETDDADDPRIDLTTEKKIIYSETSTEKYEIDGFSKRKLRFEIELRDGKREHTIYFDIEKETCVPYKIDYTDEDGEVASYDLVKLR